MKKYKYPILALIIWIVINFLKGTLDSQFLWRVLDVFNYLLFPVILLLFIKRFSTKISQFQSIVGILVGYLLISILTQYDYLADYVDYHKITSFSPLVDLRSIQSAMFVGWLFTTTVLVVIISNMIYSWKAILKKAVFKNQVIKAGIALCVLLYLLDYGFFEPHPGWTGFHGHHLWESGGHLH